MIEIEVKAKVDSLNVLKEKLLSLNANLTNTETHLDQVYGYPNKFPPLDGEIIARIRQKQNNKLVLELKEINRETGGIELKYPISEIEIYENFLSKMGFKHFFTVKKNRKKYQLGKFTICLDEVEELGSFIEVEKLIEKDILKEETMQDCILLLNKLAPDAVISNDKYGDMLCKKLNISRNV